MQKLKVFLFIICIISIVTSAVCSRSYMYNHLDGLWIDPEGGHLLHIEYNQSIGELTVTARENLGAVGWKSARVQITGNALKMSFNNTVQPS